MLLSAGTWLHRGVSIPAAASALDPMAHAAPRPAADPSASAAGAASVRAEAVIDTDAISNNTALLLRRLRSVNPAAMLMAVVKADGYGHGAIESVRAALRGGAAAVGVATPTEGLQVRAAGVTAPVLAWLWPAGEDIRPALAAGVELGISSLAHLDAVLAAGAPFPRIQVKVDTGLGRNGVGPFEIDAVLSAVAAAQRAGRLEVAGLMSHLANADVPGDRSVAEQAAAYRDVLERAERLELRVGVRHLANTPAVIDHPDTYFDMGRCGVGLYGLNPVTTPTGLRPAMTLRGTVALTKRVPAGYGVSYGLTYRTSAETTLALIPLGYADGIPRAASSTGEVWLGGRRRRIAGRVAMDQFVVDCGDDDVMAGAEVIIFGPGDQGEPTADEWAQWCGTINYEIVTRIGPRVPRRYIGAGATDLDPEAGVDQ